MMLLLGLVLLICHSSTAGILNVDISDDGSYSIIINGKKWLQSAPTYFIVDGQRRTVSDGTLYNNSSFSGHDVDEVGKYRFQRVNYTAGRSLIGCGMNIYSDNVVVFEQVFWTGVQNSRLPNCAKDHKCYQETTGAFPSFLVEQPEKINLGYLNYGGNMIGNDKKMFGRWNSHATHFTAGIAGGPIAIFDENGTTVLLSTLNNFMSSSFWHEGGKGGRVNWGVMGGVKSIPSSHKQKIILLAADSINKAFDNFGKVLQKLYGTAEKRLFNIQNDVTLKYLGYYTDNGAYYYYLTERNKTYEDTIKDIYDYSKKENIPYRYIQLDSWWYYKGFGGAVKSWTGRPDIFPHGIRSIQEYTKWPIAAHNRYWAIDNVYSKHNGGPYNFVMQSSHPKVAVPNDNVFWYDLLKNGTKWGLVMYEQDWLDYETKMSQHLQEDINLGDIWLKQMGQAAELNGLTIQYCMAYPRHVLSSIEIPVVTQSRASLDYPLADDQWKIGVSSIFANAIGFVPSKDTFYTNGKPSGNPRYPHIHELWPALQVAVATLSTGPVGPGDIIGFTNKDILMRCCNVEGLILKPSKPALAIDKQIIKKAMPETYGPNGQVWTTISRINGLQPTVSIFGILLAANMTNSIFIKPDDTGFPIQLNHSVVYPYNKPNQVQSFGPLDSLALSGCTSTNFCLYYFSPVFTVNGYEISIYGEVDKYVPMSPQRVTNMFISADDIILDFVGAPHEKVTFSYTINNAVETFSTWFTNSRVIRLSLLTGKSSHKI